MYRHYSGDMPSSTLSIDNRQAGEGISRVCFDKTLNNADGEKTLESCNGKCDTEQDTGTEGRLMLSYPDVFHFVFFLYSYPESVVCVMQCHHYFRVTTSRSSSQCFCRCASSLFFFFFDIDPQMS